MAILGQNGTSGAWSLSSYDFVLSLFEAPANGEITTINAYIKRWFSDGNMNLQVGIYNDNSGSPGTHIAHSNTFIEYVSSSVGTWIEGTLTSPVTLVSGQKYWLALQCDNVSIVYHYITNASGKRGRDADWTYGDWSDSPSVDSLSTGLDIALYSDIAISGEYIENPEFVIISSLSEEDEQHPYQENVAFTIISELTETNIQEYVEEESFTIISSFTGEVAGIPASYANRIIFTNSGLIITCDESPAKIVKIDLQSGGVPSFSVYELDLVGESYEYAKDVCLNITFNDVYVGCADGKVAKINFDDFNDREEIVTESESGANTLTNLDCVNDLKFTFMGSDSSTAELFKLDESTLTKLNTDFRFNLSLKEIINTFISFIKAKILNTDFRFLGTIKKLLKTDFRFLRYDYDEIEPKGRTDFLVKVNGVEITDTDLTSIRIRLAEDTNSEATFIVGRKHDKPNYTVDGTYLPINTDSTVNIYFNNVLLFSGKINQLDCSGSSERITVSAIGEEPEKKYHTVNLLLPSVNETRHLYHVIIDEINIKDPTIINEYNEDNPFYRGIKVDLGTDEKEISSKWSRIGGIGSLLEGVQNGTWRPKQNWTYFWFVYANNLINNRTLSGRYVGTSLSPLSDDLWEMTGLSVQYQRIFDNETQELGYYYVGSSPYKEISVKNGKYTSASKWVDKEDGLYTETGESYDYVDYAKKVAEIEYEKLKDANNVAPSDSNYRIATVSINLTIDAYLYYNLGLLTSINIDNTTEVDVYKNNNGFPVRIKEIVIDSNSMIVNLNADNQKTLTELEEIDEEEYPDEPTVTPATSSLRNSKFDPNRYEEVQ